MSSQRFRDPLCTVFTLKSIFHGVHLRLLDLAYLASVLLLVISGKWTVVLVIFAPFHFKCLCYLHFRCLCYLHFTYKDKCADCQFSACVEPFIILSFSLFH